MANVLPPDDRKALQYQYALRLFTTLTFVVAMAVLIGATSLVPAFLFSKSELGEIEQYQLIQNETRKVAKQDNAIVTARFTRSLIEQALLSERIRVTRVLDSVLRDWERHANDVIISSFVFETPDEKGAVPELRLSGRARDRASLNTFVQTLRRDPAFANVALPVSDLAGEEQPTFSIKISFKEEK